MKNKVFRIFPAVILLTIIAMIFSGCKETNNNIGQNDNSNDNSNDNLNNMAWSTMHYSIGSYDKVCNITTKYHFIDGDSIVGNTTYNKLYYYKDEQHTERFYEGLIRKDNSKLYFVPQKTNQEYLMYDFNLVEGSVFEGKYIDGTSYKYYVKKVDNVNIIGKEIKRIQFSYSANNSKIIDIWYDNIGSIQGLFNTVYVQYDGANKILLCAQNNGEVVYKNSKFAKCYYDNDDIEEVDNILNSNNNSNDNLNNMAWSTMHYSIGSYDKVCNITTKYHFIDGDSIVGNTTYNKLYYYKDEQHTERFYEGLIRKDNSKLYFVPQKTNQEYLMYDFNLVEGSVFEGKYIDGTSYKYYVKKVDNVNIIGKEIKRIQFSYSANNSKIIDIWYDNIGSIQGLFNTVYVQYDGANKILLCAQNNGEVVYKNSKFTKCYYDNDDIEEVDNILKSNK